METGQLQSILQGRSQRRLARRIRAAGLYDRKGLADFAWEDAPSLPRSALEELAGGRFIREGQNVLFLGPARGKTHLANAIALAAIKQDLTVRYRTVGRLADEIGAADCGQQKQHALHRLGRPDLLVIEGDQWPSSPSESRAWLLDVIARRDSKSTLFISRRPLLYWAAFFQDLPHAGFILGRFVSRSTIIGFDCLRLRHDNDPLWRSALPERSQALLPLFPPPRPQPTTGT